MDNKTRNLIILLLYDTFRDRISLRRLASITGTTPTTAKNVRDKINTDLDSFILEDIPSDLSEEILELQRLNTQSLIIPPDAVNQKKTVRGSDDVTQNMALFPEPEPTIKNQRKTWGQKDYDKLDPVGRIYWHFEKIRLGEKPYRKQYYDTSPGGNYGKAGSHIKRALGRGYTIERLIPSIIEYHEDDDPWVEGHPIDRWAAQIDKYSKRAEANSGRARKSHYVNPEDIRAQEQEQLKRLRKTTDNDDGRKRKDTTA